MKFSTRIEELRKEINRIGVNINQVTKKVNEDNQANLNEFSQILEFQKHLKDTVRQFIQKQENQTKVQDRWL
jgi:hypothetical protein